MVLALVSLACNFNMPSFFIPFFSNYSLWIRKTKAAAKTGDAVRDFDTTVKQWKSRAWGHVGYRVCVYSQKV